MTHLEENLDELQEQAIVRKSRATAVDEKSRFDNKLLVALALLTAASDPGQKDLLIRLIVNLLAEQD